MDEAVAKQITLKDFINQNHNLLSGMAVLVAIASFVKGLSVIWLANTLFFLSIAGVAILWLELYSQFPKKVGFRLFAFKQIISLALMGLILYWLLAFPTFWNIFLFIPLTFILTAMFIKVLNQFSSFMIVRRIFGEKNSRNEWQKVLAVVYSLGVFVAINWIIYISVNATPGFSYLLQIIRLNFN